jgi:hypothetical protein
LRSREESSDGALNGTSNFDTIKQTIATANGGTDTLSFYVGGSTDSAFNSNLFQVEWDGNMPFNSSAPVDQVSAGVYDMTLETYTVTGTGSDVSVSIEITRATLILPEPDSTT